jgi:hypothetical protein
MWALRQVHEMFNKELRRDIPAQYINSFALVAENEGLTVNEYAERSGVSKSVMSRHLLDIGDRFRDGKPGFGLVTSRPKIEDNRAHEVLLTERAGAWQSAFVSSYGYQRRYEGNVLNLPNKSAKNTMDGGGGLKAQGALPSIMHPIGAKSQRHAPDGLLRRMAASPRARICAPP